MKNRLALMLLMFLAAMNSISVAAGDASGANKARTFALVVSGVSKEPQDSLSKSTSVAMLRAFLIDTAKVDADYLRVLVDSGPDRITDGGKSTRESIHVAIQDLARRIRPGDRLLLFYIGQANVVGESLRLNLPGPDVTAGVLAEWLKPIEASEMLIVLDCPGSGAAAKAMSGAGRVVICACEAEQRYSTQFSEYFVPALQDPGSDSDNNGRVSVLEAFTSASRLVDDWYRQRKLLTTETPVLEDDGDGVPSERPWRYESDLSDGSLAAQFFLVPKQR